MKKTAYFVTVGAILMAVLSRAEDLSFSDPALTPKPPAYAIGLASRVSTLDALRGFKNPPAGFGAVPFFWWLGDPLTRERLTWELDKLSGHRISGLQINYAHGTHGGMSYGSTLPSDPSLFSDDWWKLTDWFLQTCKQRGIAISLSDYTLGIGQGWSVDKMLASDPDLNGFVLHHETKPVTSGVLAFEVGLETVSLTAYRMENDQVVSGSGVDLRPQVKGGKLSWSAPSGKWRVSVVRAQRQVPSIDPMNPRSGAEYAKAFFGQFEQRNPGEGGKGLNFFFSDELGFGIGGNIWTPLFAQEFKKRKGYDIAPELAALWTDIGPRTAKLRLDYSDVKVALSEEGFFKPVFDWHQSRGMIMGCDHGGRGGDVTEFGDYFRTQRWNQGPGADQPGLGKDLIKAKVASSIAHLYQRPRVWLEGWYGSGWGTTSSGATDALFADFAMGYNLLSFHGLYYATHGGWWEWAPPCNCYHMPYWEHMGPFMECAERLSYLMTQGTHVCDVAVIYPVASVEAGLGGDAAVQTAFGSGRALYDRNVDFDFMDFQSLDRATFENGRICVSGESYRVLVLPAMRAIRHSTLEKAAEFTRKGGTVIVVGALPEASDRQGLKDPEIDRLNREMFGMGSADKASLPIITHLTAGAGKGIVVGSAADLASVLDADPQPDFRRITGSGGYFIHRKLGRSDLYALYAVPKNEECVFRAIGRAELWNPWTGETKPLPVIEQTATTTRLHLPLSEKEMSLIVFTPGQPVFADQTAVDDVKPKIQVSGDWEFELKPSQDNRWGDFHWPPTPTFIGAEVRYFRYADETPGAVGWENPAFDDKDWASQTYSYGPQFWKLGPLASDTDTKALEEALAAADDINPANPVRVGEKEYRWKSYDFSWRFGVEGDPGYQGYHGLKERLYDDYIRLGKLVDKHTVYQREPESAGTRYYLWTSVTAAAAGSHKLLHGGMEPSQAWLNGSALASKVDHAELHAGANPLLLRYDHAGTSHFTFATPQSSLKDSPPPSSKPEAGLTLGTIAMRWNDEPTVLHFDTRSKEQKPAGWYRFASAPGLRALTVVAYGKLTAWADGAKCVAAPGTRRSNGAVEYRVTVASPSPKSVLVALRIEQERGFYGGAAIPEPVSQECGVGNIATGDWGLIDGLRCYSGGAWYRKTISLKPGSKNGKVFLDLGNVVSTAELLVNGKPAGIKVSPPWRWDVTGLVKPGENRVEVLIYNTLANHYLTIPSRYKSPAQSGLVGPVTLEVVEPMDPKKYKDQTVARLQHCVSAVAEALSTRPDEAGPEIKAALARGNQMLGSNKEFVLRDSLPVIRVLEQALENFKQPSLPPAERNLAHRKPVQASSVHPSTSVQTLTQGQRNGESFWSSDDAQERNDHGEWVMIDLVKATSVDTVFIFPRGSDKGEGFPRDLRLSISLDGKKWETAVSLDDVPEPAGRPRGFKFPACQARYVRIESPRLRQLHSDDNRYRMQLSAVEVFGPASN